MKLPPLFLTAGVVLWIVALQLPFTHLGVHMTITSWNWPYLIIKPTFSTFSHLLILVCKVQICLPVVDLKQSLNLHHSPSILIYEEIFGSLWVGQYGVWLNWLIWLPLKHYLFFQTWFGWPPSSSSGERA